MIKINNDNLKLSQKSIFEYANYISKEDLFKNNIEDILINNDFKIINDNLNLIKVKHKLKEIYIIKSLNQYDRETKLIEMYGLYLLHFFKGQTEGVLNLTDLNSYLRYVILNFNLAYQLPKYRLEVIIKDNNNPLLVIASEFNVSIDKAYSRLELFIKNNI